MPRPSPTRYTWIRPSPKKCWMPGSSSKKMGYNASPARKSVSPPTGQTQGPGPAVTLSPELQALSDQALASGLSNADLRYSDYLNLALNKMSSGTMDAHTALQTIGAQAAQDQQTAINDKATTTLVVNTPMPVVAAPVRLRSISGSPR